MCATRLEQRRQGFVPRRFRPHDSTDAGIKSSRGVEITAPIILVLTWLVMIPL